MKDFMGWQRGIVEEDGLRLTTYTYSEDGYRIGFSRGKLMATLSDGRTTELVPVPGEQLTTSLDQLSGIRPRSIQETLYRRPEGAVVTEASLHAEKPVCHIAGTGKCAGDSHSRRAAAFGYGGGIQGLEDISDRHQSHG